MPFPVFDRSRLRIQPLAQRVHDPDLSVVKALDAAWPHSRTRHCLSWAGASLKPNGPAAVACC